MWTFKPGWLGVSIAVIALLGGVLLGSLLNVSSHNESTTKYDYVSDISGLFETTNEPQYIDFNPATNYTGYTNADASEYVGNPTGLRFTSGLANSYRVPIRASETITGASGTVNNNTSLPQIDLGGKIPSSGRLASAEYVHSGAFTSSVTQFKISTVYDWAVATYGNLNDYSSITVYVNIGNYTSPSTRGAFCATFSSSGDETTIYNFLGAPGSNRYDLNIQDLTVTYYLGTNSVPYTLSMFDAYMCYGDARQIESYYDTSAREWVYTSDSTTLSFSYTSEIVLTPQYDYLMPSSGVGIASDGGATIWDNDTTSMDYDNQIVDIVIGPTFDNGTWTLSNGLINVGVSDSNSYTYRTLTYNGSKWVGLNDIGDLGAFRAIMLRLEKVDSGVNFSIYGVMSFISYTDLSISPVVLYSGSIARSDLSLDSLRFSGTLSWSVYNTKVFMDTYGAVLVDPSINLADYWPDMSSYRYAFQSFALYGDSITMNGVTYPVTNERITINDKAYKLDNFYLSFSEQGDTSITFKNVNKTLSLGPTVDKVVSFGGNWGFTTGLYEGHIDVKKVYDWNIKLLGDNLNTIMLIALGLVAVMMLACKWLGLSLKMTDKIVLGGSALFMVLLLVV